MYQLRIDLASAIQGAKDLTAMKGAVITVLESLLGDIINQAGRGDDARKQIEIRVTRLEAAMASVEARLGSVETALRQR